MTQYDSKRYAMVNRWDPSHLRRLDQVMPLDVDTRVLEVGCGSGHLTTRLANRGVDIVGIDANPNTIDVSGSDRVLCMRAEALDFPDDEFDAIVSVHAIEHIPELEDALAEMARVLKPGGRATFIYPAEPIMGMYAIPTSVILYGTPF
jgi:ubiquinone/menaquinone biosynthesis C-methylase UbiE